jgi:3alpha(or 20beta)-hydroxysteroid dehydrogenase
VADEARELEGRTVVVTGAARGQGAAEARLLTRLGAHVVLTDVLDDEGEALATEFAALGKAEYVHLDVTNEQDWAVLADGLGGRGQSVHGLVNNAGVPQRARVGEVDVAAWNRTLAINVTGPLLGIQALLPLMGPGSSIVNVGSVAGLTGHHAAPYTASKWALRGLTQTAALELGQRGIRVNIVHPGMVRTPILDAAPAAFTDAHLSITPLGRPGTVDEIAEVVVFLLTDRASYVSGAELPVDGGFSGHGGAMVTSRAARIPSPGTES